jgi:hypothetical protein
MKFSSEWLARYNARNAPESAGSNGPAIAEAEIHAFILDFCKQNRWIAFHGSMAHKTHRTEGEPDFVILQEDGRVLMIECKTRRSKLSVEQCVMAHWAKSLGHDIHVVRSIAEADAVLKTNSK